MARLREESQRVRNIAVSSKKVTKRYKFKSKDGLRLLRCSKDDIGRNRRLRRKESADAANLTRLAKMLGSIAHNIKRTNWRLVNAAMVY
jgi:hypothetical protein